ncbi:MAG TPA: SRPBCC family protein [Thermoanaerobaculia bacterium]
MSRRFVLERTTYIAASLPEVFEFFSAPANLGRITPPRMKFQIVSAPSRGLREGDRIDYRIRVFGLPARWTTKICMWRENEAFADLQERGPYRFWLHTHTFRASGEGVEMHDRVEYELPFGWLGRLFGAWLVGRELRAIFDYRAEVIKRIFVEGR